MRGESKTTGTSHEAYLQGLSQKPRPDRTPFLRPSTLLVMWLGRPIHKIASRDRVYRHRLAVQAALEIIPYFGVRSMPYHNMLWIDAG